MSMTLIVEIMHEFIYMLAIHNSTNRYTVFTEIAVFIVSSSVAIIAE